MLSARLHSVVSQDTPTNASEKPTKRMAMLAIATLQRGERWQWAAAGVSCCMGLPEAGKSHGLPVSHPQGAGA